MRSLPWIAVCLSGLLLSPAARAGDPEVTELRREVSDLRREVSDLRRELYALRLDILSALEELKGAPLSPRAPVGTPPRDLPPPGVDPRDTPGESEAATGKLVGTVKLSGKAEVAYVYVENVPQKMARGKAIEIAQVKRQFAPRWAVVQVGTRIDFPNQDSIFHNVFSTTPGSSFDLGIYRAGEETKSYTMTKPGVVDIYCDMHSEMSASVLVVPSPLWTQVGKDGRYTLPDVPKGSRRIVAWSPGHQTSVQSVNVAGGKEQKLEFSLASAPSGHTNKNGQPYGSYK